MVRRDGRYCMLYILTSAPAQEDPGKEMWTKYMNVFKDYDKRISDTWTEDATGLLVFVSVILRYRCHHNDKPKDWPFLRNGWSLYH